MKIFKYTLDLIDLQSLELPVGAKVLAVQVQNGNPQIWALVDENAQKEVRTFATYGTGHVVANNPCNYIGTYQLENGAFVFHVFEKLAYLND
ncbi:MAG: hypothetical protein IPI97_14155 [Nitrosomonas sp.]|nr:hypothetical protein [Nitrosomonas sp.]